MIPEFDQYALEYARLLRDPARDRFASDSKFFHHRKAALIVAFLARRKLDPSRLSWLDVGCGQGELLRLAGYFARSMGCDPSKSSGTGVLGGNMRSSPANPMRYEGETVNLTIVNLTTAVPHPAEDEAPKYDHCAVSGPDSEAGRPPEVSPSPAVDAGAEGQHLVRAEVHARECSRGEVRR